MVRDEESSGSVLKFAILGTLEVRGPAGPVTLTGARQRAALAALLLHPNRVVPVDDLINGLWPRHPPATARDQVQIVVSSLRRALGDGGRPPARQVVVTRPPGYMLRIEPDHLDVLRFEALIQDADGQLTAGHRDRAASTLRAALGLWRGPALADVPTPITAIEARRLAELRLATVEKLVELELTLGRYGELVPELTRLVAEHPHHERLRGLLMTTLDLAGRKADALQVYRTGRRYLVDELGLEPGPQLRRLEQQILADVDTDRPARSPGLPGAPAHLPMDVPGFTGRTEALRRLDTILAQAPADSAAAVVVALSGAAGIGKTSIAVRWAHRVRDRFPDGQLYVNLRGFGPGRSAMAPAEAVRGFLDALGVAAAQVPATLDAQTRLFRGLLAGRRMLVLLDNARDAEQVRPLLPGAPGCAVLVTSRNQLAGLAAAEGAHLLILDLLSPAEARQLLAYRVGAERVAAEPEAVDEIIRYCARLPLALAIAAACAATNPGFPLAVLAAELRKSHGRLDAFENGDIATDVRTVLSWSYEALGDDAARLFRLLGLHPGPDVAAPAAASLAGLPVRRARALLAALTRTHLIQEHAPGRYACHDLLRAYAAELVNTVDSDDDRRAAVHRMLDHYLHAAHAADLLLQPGRDPIDLTAPRAGVVPEIPADYGQALAWFSAEHLVLLAAVDQAANDAFDGHAWQLALTLGDFLDRQGRFQEQVAVQHTALRAARRLADRIAEAHAHRALGRAYIRLRRYDDAATHLRHALDLLSALGDRVGQARVHLNLTFMFGESNRFPAALEHARQAVALYEATGKHAMRANALNSFGWCQAHVGDFHPALASCRRALAMLEEFGDRRGQLHTWNSLGYIHQRMGDHGQAIGCYQRALELGREDGDRLLQADTLDSLGDTQHAAADQRSALRNWRHALAIFDELGHPRADQVRNKLGRG